MLSIKNTLFFENLTQLQLGTYTICMRKIRTHKSDYKKCLKYLIILTLKLA